MSSPDTRERTPDSAVSRPTYDTLAHKLARAGYLHKFIYALLVGPVATGMIYATYFGASEVVTLEGEQFRAVNIAQPIGVAHFVFLAVAILLFGGLFFGPGLKANVRTVHGIQQSKNPRDYHENQTRSLLIGLYAVFAIPMLLGMSLGDAVGSDIVRWIATGIGWVTFAAAALLIRNQMQKLFSEAPTPDHDGNAS